MVNLKLIEIGGIEPPKKSKILITIFSDWIVYNLELFWKNFGENSCRGHFRGCRTACAPPGGSMSTLTAWGPHFEAGNQSLLNKWTSISTNADAADLMSRGTSTWRTIESLVVREGKKIEVIFLSWWVVWVSIGIKEKEKSNSKFSRHKR